MEKNKYSFKERFVYGGLGKEEMYSVLPEVYETNRRTLVQFSAIGFIICVLLLFIPFRLYANGRIFNICIMTICLLVFIASQTLLKNHRHAVYPVQLFICALFMTIGLHMSLLFTPEFPSVIYVAFLVAVPIMFIDMTLRIASLSIVCDIVYFIIAPMVKPEAVLRYDTYTIILFTVVGLAIGHTVNCARFERFMFARSARKLAEIQTYYATRDQMTGLRNHRSYAEELERLSQSMPETCRFISLDVNGLKVLNDTYGHEAGDTLLVGAAECMRSAFEGEDRIYRTGGDEFCIITDCSDEKLTECLEAMDKKCAAFDKGSVHGISICYGTASASEGNIITMKDIADKRLYDNKEIYYQTHTRIPLK